MKRCPFCCEEIPDDARKCRQCGEILSFLGRVLRVIPLLSILIAAGSLTIALAEIVGRQAAETRERAAVERLEVVELAAESALEEFATRLDRDSTRNVRSSLGIAPGTKSTQLELEARNNPKNVDLQKKAMALKALERR